jgi:hypothetical protein
VAEAGVEHHAESPEKTLVSSTGGAEYGALGPDFATLAMLWPSLSPLIQAPILDTARGAIR